MRMEVPACHALPQPLYFAQNTLLGAANAGHCDLRIALPEISLPPVGTVGGWLVAGDAMRSHHLDDLLDVHDAPSEFGSGASDVNRGCQFVLSATLDAHLHALVARGRLDVWRAAQRVRVRDASNKCGLDGAPTASDLLSASDEAGPEGGSTMPDSMGLQGVAGPLTLLGMAIGPCLTPPLPIIWEP